MFCQSCGTQNEDTAVLCTKCHKNIKETTPAATENGTIKNYLTPAILTTIFCSLPFGIPAIVFAKRVNSKLAAGDLAGAKEASKKAKTWCWVSFGVGLVWGLLIAAIAIPNFMHMGDRAKDSSVKANMHTIQLAADDFATHADGIYPINQTSIAPGGTTFESLWPSNLKNPWNKNIDAVVVCGAEPDWDEIKEGQVVYMPTGITKKGATGYVISGKSHYMGKLKLTSGQ